MVSIKERVMEFVLLIPGSNVFTKKVANFRHFNAVKYPAVAIAERTKEVSVYHQMPDMLPGAVHR